VPGAVTFTDADDEHDEHDDCDDRQESGYRDNALEKAIGSLPFP
jgi:hypothetical protein